MATSRRLALTLSLTFALAACSQAEGEPCQLARDCDDGLICDIPRGSERGKCVSPSELPDDISDAGEDADVPRDAFILDEPDGATDVTPSDDAGADDDAG